MVCVCVVWECGCLASYLCIYKYVVTRYLKIRNSFCKFFFFFLMLCILSISAALLEFDSNELMFTKASLLVVIPQCPLVPKEFKWMTEVKDAPFSLVSFCFFLPFFWDFVCRPRRMFAPYFSNLSSYLLYIMLLENDPMHEPYIKIVCINVCISINRTLATTSGNAVISW